MATTRTVTSSSFTVTSPADSVRLDRGRGAGVTPEFDLIKRSVRVGSAEAAEATDPATVPEAMNWPLVLEFARAHGVLALVARSLEAERWNGVPDDVVQALTGYRLQLAARNLVLSRKLLQLLDQLARNGITAIPYKGPVLAALAYGDIGLRPFVDLDLILSEADVLRARSVLLADGYESLSPRADSARPGALPPGYNVPLRCVADGVVVELHWKLSPSSPLTIEWLLPGTRPFPLLQTNVPCLAPEHLLLALCVHGTKHVWERLEFVCAVAHLVGRAAELDWDRLRRDARSLRAGRSVALGLALAARIADAPLPEGFLDALGERAVPALAADIEARLFQPESASLSATSRYSTLLRIATREERVRYFLFLHRPTEKDRAFVPLPSGLSFLYALVRPCRLLYEQTLAKRRTAGVPAQRRHADRARARQLAHQQQKAATLDGRHDVVVAALALRWDRVQRRVKSVNPDLDNPRLLEVGSGAHGILFGCRSERAVGVDPLAIDYKRLFPAWQCAVPTVAAAGERLPFGDGSFDVVLSDNVVDHAERPAAILAEMARVLAPGGVLYFTVNVHHRLYSIVAKAHHAWTAAGIPVEIGPFADHTFHFTPKEARDLFDGLPLDIRGEHIYWDEAKMRARRRKFRHPGHLLPLVLPKNAPYEVLAVRR